ncbi:MAG: 7,8-didemethyl-8-hydroxy-5-deazariboflavin synthase subunit CofG [Candidatus Methanoperedens sp.]|nr:7,8-didemethyl-8-hydroxy-5-deazariboflavin synthase subunit CofG [Candidatus Methanoperedens sp.]
MSFVTFSRNVFIPLTNVCRNKCGYCGFRRDMGHPEAKLLSPGEAMDILSKGARAGCSEALFTFGERPEEVPGFREWLCGYGYENIIDYVLDLCKLSIRFGLLPHTNAGILEKPELEKLRPYNASMGLMLETLADIKAHEDCAGKNPGSRIKTIEYAGELKIPFTTGILVGIGETWEERVRSIHKIRELHEEFGHIQEVIIQNFIPKPGTKMASCDVPGLDEMIRTVKMARELLPSDITIQVPPNLIPPRELVKCGASDLGGISPETIDHINPESPWPNYLELRKMVDFPLHERLPIYPKYIKKGWYSAHTRDILNRLSDAEGFRKTYKQVSH